MRAGTAASELVWAFGGANGMRGRRGGDIGCEREPVSQFFQLQPEQCQGNEFTIASNTFVLHSKPATIAGVASAGAKLAVADATKWAKLDDLLASALERRAPARHDDSSASKTPGRRPALHSPSSSARQNCRPISRFIWHCNRPATVRQPSSQTICQRCSCRRGTSPRHRGAGRRGNARPVHQRRGGRA